MKKNKVSLIKSPDGTSYLIPFILITSLFLLWGFAHGLLDVLNKHFQNILNVSKAQSGFVQFSLYIGYFAMAIPAGLIMKRFGYKKGIIFGLLLFATGAFLFYPAAKFESFWPFLLALFIIACGLTCLETAANPYTTVLGPRETASQRINFSQSFNGLGWILGPLIGGLLIFGSNETGAGKFDSLLTPYMLIGSIVLIVAVAFVFTSLPEIKEEANHEQEENPPMRMLLKHPFFIGSSFLVMAVAGGAFCPPLMGYIADSFNMAVGFLIPLVCFMFICYFGIISARKSIKSQQNKLNPISL